MSDRAGGAAWRRRERRLRSWAKHERLTVAMALAEAFHHSAPWRQDTARAMEGVEGEANDVPRHQKPPPAGTRPAPLDEVTVPQGFWPGALRQPGSGVPSLSSPVLADTTVDGVDVGALSRGGREEGGGGQGGEGGGEAGGGADRRELEAIEPGCWERATDAARRTYFWHRLSKRVR